MTPSQPPNNTTVEASMFCWLIEAPGAHFLATRTLGCHEFHWTTDPNAALRFWSEQQADQTMMAVRELNPDLFGFAVTLGDARAVEHGWLFQSNTAGAPK